MPPYKVMVVDDSAFMRKMISDFISDDPQFEVISLAKNGKEAVEKAMLLKPDVITLDIEMPEMNGLQALKHIMTQSPTPVVMLSTLTQEGARETILALELGAVDFIRKPSGSISLDIATIKNDILEKLKLAVKANIRKNGMPFEAKLINKPKPEGSLINNNRKTNKKFTHIVAIGTSTGGPKALQQVISQIPSDIAAPILIVQHMPPNFTKSLAQRLDSISNIHVLEAEDNMLIQAGTAYIAPGGWHMMLFKDSSSEYKIKLSKEDPENGHRPSVDKLYKSLLPFTELTRHLVIMTGMGSDGARGMKELHDTGVDSTIAESEDTCVVYGMPRSAVELNCVKYILPLHNISTKLAELVPNL